MFEIAVDNIDNFDYTNYCKCLSIGLVIPIDLGRW